MRNIKIVIEYDGTDFNGFQKQTIKNSRTIQNELETVLERLLGEKTKTTVAGRTDTGVHATFQVVNFKTISEIPLFQLRKALNSLLPESIAVKSAQEVPIDFHARFSALNRTYQYYILNNELPVSLGRMYICHIRKPLDIEKMKEGADYLIGENDFTSFSTCIKEAKSPIRRVDYIKIHKASQCFEKGLNIVAPCRAEYYKDLIVIEIKGNGFLRSMVRMIVATLIRAGSGKLEPVEIKKILEKKNPGLVHTPAPARGLFLINIEYKEGNEYNLKNLDIRNKK